MSLLGENFVDLERALDRVARVAPDRAVRARSALERALTPLSASTWPEVVRSFSWLTNTGYPVELAWASRDSSVRWTADIAAPEHCERERVAQVLRSQRELTGAYAALSGAGPSSELDDWCTAQQGALKYGAWLGMRHGERDDQSKVYLELSGGLCACQARRHELLRIPCLYWRMAGFLPNGVRELYARGPIDCALLDRIEVCSLPTGASQPEHRETRAHEVQPRAAGRLSRAARSLIGGELPARAGVSVALDSEDRVLAVTWFCFAKNVFRDDLCTQRAVLRAASEHACAPGSLELYQALAAGADDGRWRHAIIGVGLAADGSTWIQAGIRPT